MKQLSDLRYPRISVFSKEHFEKIIENDFIIEIQIDHNFYIEYHAKGIEEEEIFDFRESQEFKNGFEEIDSHKYEKYNRVSDMMIIRLDNEF